MPASKPAPRPEPAQVAYVMNGFPRLSETFIAHEIHQLERLGLAMRLYVVKRENEPKVHPVVAAIRAPLVHLPKASSLSGNTLVAWLRENAPRFASAHAAVALRHPLRWAGALGTALGLAWQHRSGGRLRKVFIKEFLQAGAIAADVMRQPAIAHLHGHFCHGVATITWLAARMSGRSFSFTAHAKDIYQPELNPGRLLERKMGAARFVATCTCANADVLRGRHPRPCEVHAIYHGLDTDFFAPPPRPERLAGPPLVLAVGRFVEKKGFDQLVEACALLKQHGVDFRCLIVGEHGPAHDAVQALVQRHGLASHVQLQGAVTQDELRTLYAQARVFALPCQVMEDGDRDGFPNVLAESMAMGVPVVSTAISGIPEFIDDGEHGLLVAPRQPAALAHALRRVLTDDALAARLAAGGRRRICERFDSRRTTVELFERFQAQLPARAPAFEEAARMNLAADGGAVFAAPFNTLDDDALLAHFRGPRPVQVDVVVDAEECTAARLDGVMQGRFEFAGETHALGEAPDWLHNPSADVEWHILLHKFYYAAGLGQRWLATRDDRIARRWQALLDGWIAQVPPGFIAADVTGRRVQNWIYSTRAFVPHGAPVDAAFWRRLLVSLHEQVEYLCAHLTPKRNHRTLELYAIFLAGVAFPEMQRAAHWREFALAHTLENLRADLLADGVHCELSTDYHHLALRNWMHVRTLAERNGVAVPAEMDVLLERALGFALHVHQPDGGMPSLSDGDARGFVPLLAWGAQQYGRADLRFVATQGAQGLPPADRCGHFTASGYHVVRTDWRVPAAEAQHLVFDCGPLGEGNHGHFDALSFELFAQGRPLLVDPGRYTYSEAGALNWRVHFRGTAAHNTVCVDGLNQTRYEPKPIKEASRHAAGSVRHKIAGPAPDTTLLEQVDSPTLDLLHGRCASHAYDAVHERCIVFVDQRYWIVSDALRAPTAHDYVLNFQLGAGLVVTQHGGQLACPGLRMAQPLREGQQHTLAEAWVSARYGHKQAALAWRTQAHGSEADFDTVIWPTADAAAAFDVERLAVPGARDALRIRLGLHTDGWFHGGARAGRWQLGELEFRGRWVHWRCGADGRVLRAISHAGATLRGPLGPLPLVVVGEGA